MRSGRACWVAAVGLFISLLILSVGGQAQVRERFHSGTTEQSIQGTAEQSSEARVADQERGVWSRRYVTTGQRAGSPELEGTVPRKREAPAAVRGVEWIEQDRGAVYNQPGEYIRVRAKWSSSTPITGMRIWTDGDTYQYFSDDGTHGDMYAHDDVWTLDSLSAYLKTGKPYRIVKDAKYGCATYQWMAIQWQLTDGSWENDGYAYVRIGFVDPLFTVDVQKLAAGVWATEYCLFIEDSLQTERTFPGYPVTSSYYAHQMKPASRILYNHLPDAFDFLVVAPGTPVWIPNPVLMERVPNSLAVKNSIQGIGLTPFDHTAEWGSAGTLQGVVYHSHGPFNILAHEMGHRWMAYLDSLTFSNGYCGVHWAENQTVGGNMSLWPKVVETAPGIFKGVVTAQPDDFNACFSELDLYLMGLKPLSAVPVMKRLNNPDYTNPDTVKYSSITVTDPLTLPARYGARQPAYPGAQHSFRMATVIVKPIGWTDAEFAFFSVLARHAADTLDDGYGWNYNFEKAARRTATLESKMFTPSGIPAVPVLRAPADGASGLTSMVTVQWDSTVAATSYRVQVSKRPDFTDTVDEKSGIKGTSAMRSGLTMGTTYYWRVRAVGAMGMSRYSVPRSFTVGTSTSAGMQGDGAVLDFALMQCYPNPFNPRTAIPYDVPVRSHVTIAVFDLLGRQIATVFSGEVSEGHHTAHVEGAGLASGVYFYRMEAVSLGGESGRGFVQTKRLTVLK